MSNVPMQNQMTRMSEHNHVLVRDVLDAFSVIPARYEHVPTKDMWNVPKTNDAWLFQTIV